MSNVYRDIAKHSAVIMASRFVLKLLAVVSYFLILRELSLKEYGLVSLALSISGPALALSGLGLDDILLARGARARGEKKYSEFAPIMGGFVSVRLLILLGITVLLFFIRDLFGTQYQDIVDRFFPQAIAWIWVANVRWIGDGMAQMFERFKRFSFANITEGALRTSMVVALYFLGRLDVGTVLWVYVISKGLPILMVFPAGRELGGWRDAFSKYRTLLSFLRQNGAWETARMLSGGILSGIGQWIIAGMLGLESVAVFSFASSLNSMLSQFSPFRQVVYPVISRLSPQASSAGAVACRMSKYAIWLACLMVLGAAAAVPVGVWLLAPKYLVALPAFFLLVLAQLINALSISHSPLLYSYNEQKLLLGLSIMGTVSSVTLLPLLVWACGIYGAILENHISTSIMIIIRERLLRRKYKVATICLKGVFTFTTDDREALAKVWRLFVTKLPWMKPAEI